MTISQKNVITQALLDIETVKIKKIEALPSFPFETSKEYKEKTNKLILSERKRENSILKLNLRKKVTLLAASILILMLALTACLFKEEIRDFFISFEDATIKFFYPSQEDGYDYVEYNFEFIPEGYLLKDEFIDDNHQLLIYSNNEHSISIGQGNVKTSTSRIDTEDGSYQTATVNGHTVYFNLVKNTYNLLWKAEGNVFLLTCPEYLGWSTVEDIICGAVKTK